jgi:hypothetical protein
MLGEVEVGRIKLDVVMTDVDAILGVGWLRRNRPQFRWGNNTLRWKGKEILFEEKRITTASIKEVMVKKFARTVKKKNTIFVVNVKLITEEEDEMIENMAKLLEEYEDMFSVKSSLDLLPRRREDDHAIPMVLGVRLQARNPYKLTPEEREVLKTQLKKLTKVRHIRSSSSVWGVPVLFVRKKDGDLRMCIDCRVLNKMTVRNEYSLLKIDELLDTLQSTRFFTK